MKEKQEVLTLENSNQENLLHLFNIILHTNPLDTIIRHNGDTLISYRKLDNRGPQNNITYLHYISLIHVEVRDFMYYTETLEAKNIPHFNQNPFSNPHHLMVNKHDIHVFHQSTFLGFKDGICDILHTFRSQFSVVRHS